MPKIKITQAFNFQSGGVTKHYEKGEQNVTQAVADHAITHGYAPAPKEPEAATAKPAAAPASGKTGDKA